MRMQALGLLTLILLSTSTLAQDADWKALNAQVTELSRAGQHDRAVAVAKQALAVAERGGNQLLVATSLNSLAVLYHAQGQYADAEPLYKRSLAIKEKALGPDNPFLAPLLGNLAELYRAQGQSPRPSRSTSVRSRLRKRPFPRTIPTSPRG